MTQENEKRNYHCDKCGNDYFEDELVEKGCPDCGDALNLYEE